MVTAEHNLGRRFAPDPGDAAYSIEARRLPPRPVRRITKHWPLFRIPLNQGGEGTCVGHGWWHWLLAAPVIQNKILMGLKLTPRELYILSLAVDEWIENDWGDMQFGTSVRAGGKVLQSLGLISEYNVTQSVHTAADWLGGKDANNLFIGGPLVIGVNWYTSMFDTDAEGFLKIGGRIEGGHCTTLLGWSEPRGVFYGVNSWGINWGKRGRFMIAAEDFSRLLSEDGEAWTAVEVRQ